LRGEGGKGEKRESGRYNELHWTDKNACRERERWGDAGKRENRVGGWQRAAKKTKVEEDHHGRGKGPGKR